MKKIGQNDNASYLLEYLNILMKKTERREKKKPDFRDTFHLAQLGKSTDLWEKRQKAALWT